MFVIGLTGGIGSGKSTVAKMFGDLGAAIIDTDEIAHELTAPGGSAMAAIREQFGSDFLTQSGALDRARMRLLVFSDETSKKTLESILHPLIRAESVTRIAASRRAYEIVVVPLLLETGAYRELTDRVLVVDCPEAEQVHRVTQRSGIAEGDVRAIMAAQLPRAERLARADDVLENIGSIASLRRQVARLHAKYLELALQRS